MQLTSFESDIVDRIERSCKLNPDKLSAYEWIEQSKLTQLQIAERFDVSQRTVSNLCQKLGIQSNLVGTYDRNAIPSSPWGRGPSWFEIKKELVKECLRKAREGDEEAVLKLDTMGIKFYRPGEERS